MLQLKYLCLDNQLKVNEVNLSQKNHLKQLDCMAQIIEEMQRPSLLKQKMLPDSKIFFLELLELQLQNQDEKTQSHMRFPFIINCPAKTLTSFVALCSPRSELSEHSGDSLLKNFVANLLQQPETWEFETPVRKLQENLPFVHRLVVCCVEPVAGRIESTKRFLMPFASTQATFAKLLQELESPLNPQSPESF